MMNRFALPLVVFALLVFVLAVGIKHSPEKGIVVSPLLGKPAPEFSLPNLMQAGNTISTSQLKGRWYLFNVWGTWCIACREEHPTLLEVAKQGVIPIIGLDWRDDDSQAHSWLAQLGNPYEVIAVDRDGREAIDWGVTAAPESFLVNPQGIVVYKVTGEITPDIWEHQILPRLPREAAAKNPS